MRLYSAEEITCLDPNALHMGADEEQLLQIIRDLAAEVVFLKNELQRISEDGRLCRETM